MFLHLTMEAKLSATRYFVVAAADSTSPTDVRAASAPILAGCLFQRAGEISLGEAYLTARAQIRLREACRTARELTHLRDTNLITTLFLFQPDQ